MLPADQKIGRSAVPTGMSWHRHALPGLRPRRGLPVCERLGSVKSDAKVKASRLGLYSGRRLAPLLVLWSVDVC